MSSGISSSLSGSSSMTTAGGSCKGTDEVPLVEKPVSMVVTMLSSLVSTAVVAGN